MTRRAPTLVALAGLGLLYAGPAQAQSAEAEELFHQGRAALAAGDNATACAKLDASERLERAVGTLMSLATCEEALGHIAGARQHLQEAAEWADASHDQLHRGPIARTKFAALDRRVPRLTLRLSARAPRDTRVTRDGVDLGTAAFDTTLPVDPGKHVILAAAAGYEPGRFEVQLAEGETKSVEVAPGVAVSPTSAPSTTVPSVEVAHRTPAPPAAAAAESTSATSGLRTAGWVIGAAGLVGLGLGTYFGASASSSWSSAKSDCKPGACGPGSAALGERGTAETAATVSTVAFIGGGAALATGVLLFILGRPSTEPPAPRAPTTGWTIGPIVGVGTGGVLAHRAF